jgi:hypothetical protein
MVLPSAWLSLPMPTAIWRLYRRFYLHRRPKGGYADGPIYIVGLVRPTLTTKLCRQPR